MLNTTAQTIMHTRRDERKKSASVIPSPALLRGLHLLPLLQRANAPKHRLVLLVAGIQQLLTLVDGLLAQRARRLPNNAGCR